MRTADIVIHDCIYRDVEFLDRIGWGHSAWQKAARLCRAAGVANDVVFHHDPDHDDAVKDRIDDEAEAQHPGTLIAREGNRLRP